MNTRFAARGKAALARLGMSALALVGLPGLPACGGAVSIGFGYDGRNDRPPSVSLAASTDTAAAGQTVRLLAAASDDYGVSAVEFYRLDANVATLLSADGSAPYQLDVTIQASSTRAVQFFARAVDDANQGSESATVTVNVLP